MDQVITFVANTVDHDLNSVIAAAVNELHTLGHTVKEIRVTSDSGETKVDPNTVPGITVPEPGAPEPTPEPPPDKPGQGPKEEAPADEEAPVDPTPEEPEPDTTPSAN